MESPKRIMGFLITGTLLLLLYVHQQISILQVSYSIEKKEREVARLSEDYKISKFELTRLYSPYLLSRRVKSASLNLTTPKAREIIKVTKPRMIAPPAPVVPWPNRLPWFGFVKEAQAKTSNK